MAHMASFIEFYFHLVPPYLCGIASLYRHYDFILQELVVLLNKVTPSVPTARKLSCKCEFSLEEKHLER